MANEPVNFRSLRMQKWSDTYYKQAVDYLRNPAIIPPHLSSTQRSRFRKKMKLFKLTADDELVLETKQVLPELRDGRGNALVVSNSPTKLTVVPYSRINTVLKKEWNQASGSGLSSTFGLYKHIQTKYLGISRAAVKTFVDNQEVKQLNSSSIIDFIPVRPIIKSYPRQLFCMDLADMRSFSGANSNVNYLMIVIDHFSKFVFVIPLTSRALKEITHELEKLLYVEGKAPESMLTDNEFNDTKHEMRELYQRWNINSKATAPYSPWQNGLAERTVGTMKRRINTFMSQNNTQRYIDALPLLVHAYNNTVHSTTKFKPVDVFRYGTPQLYEKIEANTEHAGAKMIKGAKRRLAAKHNNQKTPIAVGDYVRVSTFAFTEGRKLIQSHKKRPLQTNMFSETIYRVSAVSDDRYTIVDEQNEIPENGHKNQYFRHELLGVDKDQLALREPVPVPLNFTQAGRHLPASVARASKLQEKEDQRRLEELVRAEEILIQKTSLRPRPERKMPDEQKVQQQPPRRPAREVDLARVFEVEAILSHKKVGKSLMYLVKWQGYDDDDNNTWERATSFLGEEAKQILRDYRTRNKLTIR